MVARGRSPKPLQNTVGPRILHACPSIASGADRTALTATGLSGAPGGRGILGADPVRSSCEEDQSIGPVGARPATSTPFSAAERTLGLDLWRCFVADYSRESPPWRLRRWLISFLYNSALILSTADTYTHPLNVALRATGTDVKMQELLIVPCTIPCNGSGGMEAIRRPENGTSTCPPGPRSNGRSQGSIRPIQPYSARRWANNRSRAAH